MRLVPSTNLSASLASSKMTLVFSPISLALVKRVSTISDFLLPPEVCNLALPSKRTSPSLSSMVIGPLCLGLVTIGEKTVGWGGIWWGTYRPSWLVGRSAKVVKSMIFPPSLDTPCSASSFSFFR
jgi:hypothetical protein